MEICERGYYLLYGHGERDLFSRWNIKAFYLHYALHRMKMIKMSVYTQYGDNDDEIFNRKAPVNFRVRARRDHVSTLSPQPFVSRVQLKSKRFILTRPNHVKSRDDTQPNIF